MKKSAKITYCCQTCGYQTPKWMGKCPDCGTWDSIVEERSTARSYRDPYRSPGNQNSIPVAIDSIELETEIRLLTHIREFDRVLGGGLVPGTLVLIGGDPGIGKSTLMLQALYGLANQGHRVLYVSGEESNQQIRLRSQRLDTVASELLVVSEVEIDAIMGMVQADPPQVLVIDSIQTMYNAELTSAPGSVSQVRESTVRLMMMAKKTGISTNEIGVFEMKDQGLDEVANPSAVFLSERPANAPGSTVTASMEGTRPILVELQALASSTSFGTPRRTILGLDPNRVALLAAVMEKQLGMHLMGHDIFMNVAGGVKVIEPAVDMAIVSAIASSFLDKPVPDGTVVLGEVGLAGEVRAIGQVDIRLGEAKKMGFKRCLVPESNLKRIHDIDGIEVSGINKVSEAVDTLF